MPWKISGSLMTHSMQFINENRGAEVWRLDLSSLLVDYMICIHVIGLINLNRLESEIKRRAPSAELGINSERFHQLWARFQNPGLLIIEILEAIRTVEPSFREIQDRICTELGIVLPLDVPVPLLVAHGSAFRPSAVPSRPSSPSRNPIPTPSSLVPPAQIAKGAHFISDTCSICSDNLSAQPAVRTICNHFFHNYCLLKWQIPTRTDGILMKNYNCCPICRAKLSPN